MSDEKLRQAAEQAWAYLCSDFGPDDPFRQETIKALADALDGRPLDRETERAP